MTKLEKLNNIITRLANLPQLLKDEIAGLSDEQLDTPYRDGGWSVRQVVHHLPDSHMNGYSRFKMILTEENPRLKPYDQDKWSELSDAKLPVEPSLQIITGLHFRWITFLKNLTEDQLDRTGHHPEEGDITFLGYLELYAIHGEKHLAQIRGLKTQKDWTN